MLLLALALAANIILGDDQLTAARTKPKDNCQAYSENETLVPRSFPCATQTAATDENACEFQLKVSFSPGHQSGFLDHSLKAGLGQAG